MATARKTSNNKGVIRTELNEGVYEIRIALTGTVDYDDLADEVKRVSKILLRTNYEPLDWSIRDHVAQNFRLYGSGIVNGAFTVCWKRTDSTEEGASHDLLVTVQLGS